MTKKKQSKAPMNQLMDEEHNTEFTTTLFSKTLRKRNLYIRLCFVGAHPFQAHLLVAQWQEHSPLTNATQVRLPAWEVRELGLRSLSDVGRFLRVLRFPPPTKTAKYANILAVFGLALLFET